MEIRFAIPTLDGMLATHFLKSKEVFIIDVTDNEIEEINTYALPSFEPDELAKWLDDLKVNVLIACGINHDILDAINSTGVNVRSGTEIGTPESQVEKFLNRSLKMQAILRNTG